MNPDTPLRALYNLGFKEEATIHGFRAMAMTTILEELNYPFDIVDAQLAHAQKGALGAAYDRAVYLKQRTSMMQDWADYIDNLRIVKLIAA
jgi:integrase